MSGTSPRCCIGFIRCRSGQHRIVLNGCNPHKVKVMSPWLAMPQGPAGSVGMCRKFARFCRHWPNLEPHRLTNTTPSLCFKCFSPTVCACCDSQASTAASTARSEGASIHGSRRTSTACLFAPAAKPACRPPQELPGAAELPGEGRPPQLPPPPQPLALQASRKRALQQRVMSQIEKGNWCTPHHRGRCVQRQPLAAVPSPLHRAHVLGGRPTHLLLHAQP